VLDAGPPGPHAAGPGRRRRGPLRQPVGPRLPARIPDAGPPGRAVPDVPRLAVTATADARTRDDIRAELRLEGAAEFVDSFARPELALSPSASAARAMSGSSNWSRAARPGGRRLCRQSRFHREAGREADRRGHPGAGLPRRPRQGGPRRAAGGFPRGRRRGDGGDHRVRHGRRQTRRPLRDPRRPAGLHRGLLAGGRPRRPRRPAGRGHHPLRLGRHGLGLRRIDGKDAPDEVKQAQGRKLRQFYSMLDGVTAAPPPCAAISARRAWIPAGSATSALRRRLAIDATEAAQKALSAVHRLGGRFGRGRLVEHLLGKTKDVTPQEAQLPTFGIGREFSSLPGATCSTSCCSRACCARTPMTAGR
jgi:ATP-dependent DNA helicase RecQ